jgi:hypothetical protein
MASTGRIDDARHAGYNPLKNPKTTAPATAYAITAGVI